MATILFIDSGTDASDASRLLRDAGHQAFIAQHVPEALAISYDQPIDLLVIDLDLLGEEAWQLAEQLRRRLPALLLLVYSASRRCSADIVAGLERGADGYLVAPLAAETLLAYITALLRRVQNATDGVVSSSNASFMQLGSLAINLSCREVWIGRPPKIARVALNRSEFEVLCMLARNVDRVVSADELLTAVWGPAYSGDDSAVYTRIYQIRRKLAAYPDAPRILNIPRCGYRLVASDDAPGLQDADQHTIRDSHQLIPSLHRSLRR